MRRSALLAIALLAPAATAAAQAPAAPPRQAGTQLLGADGELRFRLAERGTAQPIQLVLGRAKDARRGREREKASGAPEVGVRLEPTVARSFASQADSLFMRSPAKGDSLVATLPVTGGRLALVRQPDEQRRGRFLVHVEQGDTRATAMADSAEAWSIVQMIRAAGELMTPEGEADPSRVYRWTTEVDKAAVLSPGSCKPRYPDEVAGDNSRIGRVQVEYVVTPTGTIDPASFKVVKSSDGEFERVVRDAIPCMRFTPAEVRGQKVRMRMEQSFVFDIRQGS